MSDTIGAAIIVAIVFFGLYSLLKTLTDYLLRRKIVRNGHVEKAGILEDVEGETRRYPTLKWGLVTLFAGAGMILIQILSRAGRLNWDQGADAFLPVGIELVFISAGFLLFFFIATTKKN
ncbi:MAG: hypothetical protein NTY96_09355 [Bacteroidetes bacterium]|nr:hypothetical protein [Bacteroidota bacterium]